MCLDTKNNDGRLHQAVRDAKEIAKLAAKEGFQQVGLFLNKEATKENFFNSFKEVNDQLQPGDRFMFTFAGHGMVLSEEGSLPPEEEGEEGWDEGLCFYDGPLRDDDVARTLFELKEKTLFIGILDACHSGGAYRVKKDRKPLKEQDTEIGELVRGFKFTGAWISAARENQKSRENERGGLFTNALLHVWNEGAFSGNYYEFMKKVNRKDGNARQYPKAEPLGPHSEQFLAEANPFHEWPTLQTL